MTAVSILPPNLAPLERNIERAAGRLDVVGIPIGDLWDPMKCPVNVLPYLAWALSVDQWRSDWSEEIKRRVVADSLALHRIKGTREAVEMSLSGVRVKTKLTEWFETTPQKTRGTFDVTAFITDRGIDESLWREVDTAIKNSKNLRSHYTLTLNLLSQGAAKVAARFGQGEVSVLQPLQPSDMELSRRVSLGAVAQVANKILLQPVVYRQLSRDTKVPIVAAMQSACSDVLQPIIDRNLAQKSPVWFSSGLQVAQEFVLQPLIHDDLIHKPSLFFASGVQSLHRYVLQPLVLAKHPLRGALNYSLALHVTTDHTIHPRN